jgi:hypothetical protein
MNRGSSAIVDVINKPPTVYEPPYKVVSSMGSILYEAICNNLLS